MSYHHGDVREALLREALNALATTAPEGLSLRGLSEAVGVSHTAAYRHFPDKKALLDAVAERGFVGFRDQLTAGKASGQLDAMVGIYVGFAISQPNLYRLMFGPGFSERMSDAGACSAAQEAFAVLLDAVQEGQSAGVLRPGSPFLLSQTIWALLHGIAVFALDGQLASDDAVQVAGNAWQFLLTGIAAEKSPREVRGRKGGLRSL